MKIQGKLWWLERKRNLKNLCNNGRNKGNGYRITKWMYQNLKRRKSIKKLKKNIHEYNKYPLKLKAMRE